MGWHSYPALPVLTRSCHGGSAGQTKGLSVKLPGPGSLERKVRGTLKVAITVEKADTVLEDSPYLHCRALGIGQLISFYVYIICMDLSLLICKMVFNLVYSEDYCEINSIMSSTVNTAFGAQ